MNELCVPLKVLTVFDGVLFSSSLHVIPKEVFLITILTAVIKRHLLSESGVTETHFCLDKNGLNLSKFIQKMYSLNSL